MHLLLINAVHDLSNDVTYPISTQLHGIRVSVLVLAKGRVVNTSSNFVLILDDNEVMYGGVGKSLLYMSDQYLFDNHDV